ncbi:MAG: flagellar protein [Tindallia sp. MSAO_Bac2]|nr:MAG: flagellar protein [Tindallia sp. MSAO_Bac2]
MNYHNCPSCGRLVMGQSEGELLCKRCAKEEGDPYKRVRDYVYDHRGATVLETEAATGVSRALILQYVKEGRISLMDNRSILKVCQGCGIAIDYGEYCRDCKKKNIELELKKKGDASKSFASSFGRRRRR